MVNTSGYTSNPFWKPFSFSWGIPLGAFCLPVLICTGCSLGLVQNLYPVCSFPHHLGNFLSFSNVLNHVSLFLCFLLSWFIPLFWYSTSSSTLPPTPPPLQPPAPNLFKVTLFVTPVKFLLLSIPLLDWPHSPLCLHRTLYHSLVHHTYGALYMPSTVFNTGESKVEKMRFLFPSKFW